MRQLLYISSGRPRGAKVDIDPILERSRHNNALDGVTGLLYTDGTRFLQVLEGPDETVETTFQRIKRDPRHHAIVVLQDREVDTREFGGWSMAYRQPTDSRDAFDGRIERLLINASDSVRGTFMGLVATRGAG